MIATVIRHDDVRTTTTATGVMTTLASPTLGGSAGLSLWRVAIPAGGEGPVHAFDSEQIWTLLAGSATFIVADRPYPLTGGDTIRLAAGVPRQVRAVTDVEFVVCGHGAAVVSAPGNAANGTTPPWIA